jgi:hypothetical protein
MNVSIIKKDIGPATLNCEVAAPDMLTAINYTLQRLAEETAVALYFHSVIEKVPS